MFEILKLASIRSFVDHNMPDGMYFDVFEIKQPSPEGTYSQYDAIVTLSSKSEADKINKLFGDNKINAIAIVL